jgi:hypothetical protein
MGDIFDEFAMQIEEDEGATEPDIFDQFADEMEAEQRTIEDEDRGGDLSVNVADDEPSPASPVTAQPTATDKPSDVDDLVAAARTEDAFDDTSPLPADDGLTVRQRLAGETEDIPEALAHMPVRSVESVRKGTGNILEHAAAVAERDDPPLRNNATIIRQAVDRAREIDPNFSKELFNQEYDAIVDATKKRTAGEIRKAKDVVSVEVSPSKFKGGVLKDVDEAQAGMFEFAPSMVVSAFNVPLGMATTYSQLFGGKYEQVLKDTKNPEKAFEVATIHAMLGMPVESAGNILQIRGLSRLFKGMKLPKGMKLTPDKLLKSMQAARTVVTNTAAEAGEESIQAYTEAFADVHATAPEGATPEQINAMFFDVIKTDEFKRTRNESAKLGGIGGFMMGAGGVSIAGGVELRRAIAAKWALFRKDARYLKNVPIATQQDIDEDTAQQEEEKLEIAKRTAEQLSGGVTPEQSEEQDVDEATAAQTKEEFEARVEQRRDELQAEAQAKADEQDRVAAEQQQELQAEELAGRRQFTESLNDDQVLMATAEKADTKAINTAHKALTIGEDSVKKLKGLAYDLQHDKEAKDQGFEATTTAFKLSGLVQKRIAELEEIERLDEGEKLAATGQKVIDKELKEAEDLFTEEEVGEVPTEPFAEAQKTAEPAKPKEPAKGKDLFAVFAADAAEAAAEREIEEQQAEEAKAKIAAEKAKKDTTEEAKKGTAKRSYFSGRSFGRRRAAGISDAQSAKLDASFREQRAKAEAKAKTPPKDLKAALRLEDGTILTGTSHYEILGNLTEEQLEQVDFAKVNRGFTSSVDKFLTVDESTKKYGVTKSQQLPTVKKLVRSTSKLTPEEIESLAREGIPTPPRRKGFLTKSQAQKRVDEIPDQYMENKRIFVADTVADLPPQVRAEIKTSAALYFIAPNQKASEGTIYVVADRTANNLTLVSNVWHEMGHQGLETVMESTGQKVPLDELLKDVVKKYPLQVDRYTTIFGIEEKTAAEEVLINEFERGGDQRLSAKFRTLLLRAARALGFKFKSDLDLTDIVANMRLTAAGNTIRFGQKGYTEAREATANGMSKVRHALKPVMIKSAIKLGPIMESTIEVSEHINAVQELDEELRKQIKLQVFRDEGDIEETKQLIKKGKKKPSALAKRIAEKKRAEELIAAGKTVTQSTKTNVTNYNAALNNRPDLMKKVKQFEKDSGVSILDKNGELASAPIEQRAKPGKGRFKTLPKFGGFSRSLTQTYLDRMDALTRERFRIDMVRYIEHAYENGTAPKTFNIGLHNIGGTKYNIASAVRAANKTEGAINLNGMCPMFYVGSHGCYFDGCYVTGIGKGATNVNVHDSAIYTGELLQLSQEAIDNLNEVGGLRMNGIGDTSMQDYGQWRDVFKHAAMRGLKLKVITKQEATFEIFDKLMKDGDTRISKLAGETVIQPSLDPYWIPVEEDGRPGSFATEMGLTGNPRTAKAVISLYKQIGRDAKLINGIVHRKYGFSGEQLKAIAKKYPKIKIQPRVVVGTTLEIAEFALKQPEMLQTWMHAKVRPGMFSDVHGRTLGPDEVGNFEDRIEIKKDLLGEWVIEAQEANGKVVKNDRYTAVETFIKENYYKADADKIFSTLAGQTKKDPGALCCTSGASKNACNNCTSTCATGTYHSGKSVEDLAERNAQMAKFVSEPHITERDKQENDTHTANAEIDGSIPKTALAPVKTQTAYKLFRMDEKRPGELFPLFVEADTPVLQDEWIAASDAYHFIGANGNPYVPAKTGGTQTIPNDTIKKELLKRGLIKSMDTKSVKAVAYRPGWHSGDLPFSTHLGEQSTKGVRKVDQRADNTVWVEVELPADVDWQTEANNRATLKKDGTPLARTAQITDQIPTGGFYKYKTNPNMTGSWMISGAVKIKRVLSDQQVAEINGKYGIVDLPRKTPLDLKKYGFSTEATSEAAGKGIAKRAISPVRKDEIVQPVATGEAKLAYQPFFVSKTEAQRNKESLIDRSFLQERRRMWVDSLDMLKQLEAGQDVDDTLSGYKSATLITNAPAMIDTFLEHGNIRMEENWMKVDKANKGIAKLITELGEENVTPFFERLTAESGQELIDRFGKQNLWGKDPKTNKKIDDQGRIDEIMESTEAIYQANKVQWDRIKEDLRVINKQVMDFMRDAGIITAGQHAHMRETYIPFFRQIEDVFGENIETLIPRKGKIIQTTHALEGSEINELGEPLSNLISAYSFFIHESLRNLSWTKSLKLAKELGLVERVHKGQKGGKNIIAIRVEGEAIHYRVKNSVLFDTLVGQAQSTVNVPAWLRAPKRWLTWGVTVMPRFRMFNILRDTMSAAFMNKSIVPFYSAMEGLVHTARRSKEFVEWSSTGGNFTGSYSKRDVSVSTEKGIKKLQKKLTRKKRNGLFEFARGAAALYERLGEMSESANRMGIFLAEKRKGASVTKAAFESRDLLDFHRKGAGGVAQALIQTVPFLNARLQGLDKMARSMKGENKKRFWTAAAIMSIGSLALHYINEDNEDYKKLSDWEKIAYWHFYVGDEHFRIPTPFEVGSIFGAIPMAMYEAVKKDRTMGELFRFVGQIVANTFAFNPVPHLFKPVLEQITNFDFFRFSPIDSMRDVRVEPELRFGPGQGPTAKLIAKGLPKGFGFGPKRIEKVIRDYLGGFGDAAMGLLDVATQYLDSDTDPATTNLDGLLYMSGLEGFWPTSKTEKEPTYTKYTQKYYDFMAEANLAMNSMRVHNKTKTGKALVKKEVEFQRGEKIHRALKPYRKQLQNVNRDLRMLPFEGLSKKAFRAERERLLRERNNIYMEAVEEARREIRS